MSENEAIRKRIGKKRARAKKRGATVLEPIDNLAVYQKFNYRCCNCGIETPLEMRGSNLPNSPEMDHIIPLCKGGQHTWDNIQLLCRKCNMNKGSSVPADYTQVIFKPNRQHKHMVRRASITIEELIQGNTTINERLKEKFNTTPPGRGRSLFLFMG